VLALDAALTPVGAARAVAPMLSLDVSWAVAWTRDGRALIYDSGRYLWRVAVARDSAPERLELAGYGALSPALSGQRDRLAFVSQRNTITQHALDTTYTSPPVLASPYWDVDVQFSPDGQRLVFASQRSGEGMEIWSARADGTGARQLTRGPGTWQGSPSFSPDGRQVAFDSLHEDGTASIFVVDADGGVPRQLTSDTGDENKPVWSPDGHWIYYTSDQKAGRNVWRIPAAGGRAEQVTTGGSTYTVRVSPDGRELLYSPPGEFGNTPLLATPVSGGAPRRLLPCVRQFATSNVGVYYIECGPGPDRNVHAVAAATMRDSVIGRTRDTPYGQDLAVSPDGKTVLVERGEWTRDLMLIDNFR
jgi:WD40 repeat protein